MVLTALLDIRRTTPGLCADGKPAGQNREDQSDQKGTATDCGSLVVVNKLPRARLGHHMTLPGEDPERENSGKR